MESLQHLEGPNDHGEEGGVRGGGGRKGESDKCVLFLRTKFGDVGGDECGAGWGDGGVMRCTRTRSAENNKVEASGSCLCAITHRSHSAPEPEPERRRLPLHVPRPTPSPPSPRKPHSPLSQQRRTAVEKRLWGAYLNTFQLFRGSRSEIIETMVERLDSTGRGRGCGRTRS